MSDTFAFWFIRPLAEFMGELATLLAVGTGLGLLFLAFICVCAIFDWWDRQ